MIVVGGEALADLVPQSEPGTWRALPGGSPCNTAVALARLGQHTGFVGRLSRDAFGGEIRARLTGAGVRLDDAVAGDEPATLAVVSMDAEGAATYTFYVTGTSDFGWQPGDRARLPDPCHAVHVGSLAAVLEPAASVFGGLVASADAETVRSFDPNVRPAVGVSRDEYRTRVERWVATSDVVRTSDEDLAWLYPGEPAVQVARRWRRAGPSVVVVTCGAAGVTGLVGDDEVHAPAADVAVADTVGAGDSFSAGLLVAFAERGLLGRGPLAGIGPTELAGCLRFAADVATITCSRVGADPPWRDEVPGR